jgi:hypothetical protein
MEKHMRFAFFGKLKNSFSKIDYSNILDNIASKTKNSNRSLSFSMMSLSTF